MVALREKHNVHHKERTSRIQVGDVVIIKGEEKNRIAENFHIRFNIWFTYLQNRIESPVQLLYSLELHCRTTDDKKVSLLNPAWKNSNHSRQQQQ